MRPRRRLLDMAPRWVLVMTWIVISASVSAQSAWDRSSTPDWGGDAGESGRGATASRPSWQEASPAPWGAPSRRQWSGEDPSGWQAPTWPPGDLRWEQPAPARVESSPQWERESIQYRFRGDPMPGAGPAREFDAQSGYRFRPLSPAESSRGVDTPGWRPLEPSMSQSSREDPSNWRDPASGWRGGSSGGLMDALSPPPPSLGYEGVPWP